MVNVNFFSTYAPNLTLSKLGEPFEIVSDTSLIGARVVMRQGGRPNAFESRKCSLVERNYTIGKQELITFMHTLQIWRCYSKGGG
jgi:hypothetical protein